MPDPLRLVRTIQLARQAFLATPGRRGRWIDLQEADEILVAGDLHGHLDNFRQLLRLVDLAAQPRRHLVLQELIHGKWAYPVGGDRSHQLLDLVAALKVQFPRQVHLLPGNHELAQAANRPIAKNEADLNELFRAGVRTAYGEQAEAVYSAYLELIAVLPLVLRSANRVLLSHSLPARSRLESFNLEVLRSETIASAELEPGGTVYSLVWDRDTSADTAEAFLAKMDADHLITGHIPCETGYEVPNPRQIILDCVGRPAGYCLFPANRPLTFDELKSCVRLLE